MAEASREDTSRQQAAGDHGSPSLRELDQLSGVVTIWYRLGIHLGVRADDLDAIEKNYPRDLDMCKIKMFAEWLRCDTNPTYEKLTRALAAIGKRGLAESVYSTQETNPTIHGLESSSVPSVTEAMTGGKPHESYKMVLIGETGSGKTSFLNLIYNCSLIQALGFTKGVAHFREFNDITIENPLAGEMESKTSGAKLYEVELCGLKMGVVDTPGFGDSRRIEEDKQHTKRIVNALKKEEYLNCVCLIINGRQSRMSATLRYVLTEITSILPKESMSNIIVVFTNTAGPLDLVFSPSLLQTFLGKEIEARRIFFVDNPYCKLERAKQLQGTLELTQEQIARSLQQSFEDAGEMLTKISTTMKDFQRVHTSHFANLYQKKQEIEMQVHYLLIAYDNQQHLEKQIAKAEEEAELALERKTLSASFHSTQTIRKWTVVNTNYDNTVCGAVHCYSNCHIHCCLPNLFDKEAMITQCYSFGGSATCKQCGHSYEQHYHNKVLYKHVEYTEELVDDEMKKKFEAAETMEARATILKLKLKHKREASERKRQSLSDRLLLTLEEFHKLGINRNYAKLLENQLAVVQHYLEGSVGSQTLDLRKRIEEIEKKLQLVEATLNEPCSPNADVSVQREWACKMLGVTTVPTISRYEIEKAYREMARSNHPDKSGDNEYFKRIERAKEILLQMI